jgi:hypothetical protein
MHLKLPANYVDPRTQSPLPDAVLVVADAEVRLRAGDTRVIAAVYANASVIEVAQPITEFPVSLSLEERNTQVPALMMALYSLLSQRPEYEGSELVV